VETTTRRERPYERGKSSKRCYDWVVERGFAWMARFRRLAWGYERLPGVLAGPTFLAFACLMLHQFIQLYYSP
jgi:transposase